MHFFKKQGKQQLDLTGNLILTSNVSLISARSRSAGPQNAHNAEYVLLRKLNKRQKFRAMFRVCRFIWSGK